MSAGIVSSASKRVGVSTQTPYDAAVEKNKLIVKQQQANSKLGTLKKANENLENQLLTKHLQLPANDFPQPYYPKNYDQQLKDLQHQINYEKAMIASNTWGTEHRINNIIQLRSSTDFVTGTITTGDATKIINDIAYVESEKTKVVKKINSLNAQIKSNAKQIDTYTKILFAGSGYEPKGAVKKTTKTTEVATAPAIKPAPEFWTSDYDWNLPPHKWSLPIDPYEVNSDTVGKRTDSYHSTRRGRIWYYQGYVGPNYVADSTTGVSKVDTKSPVSVNKHGFQFVWNPETFHQNTNVNMSITPSATDPTIALTGFAAANSTMNFTLRLDRTNDFAAIASATDPATISYNAANEYINIKTGIKLSNIAPTIPTEALAYYTDGYPLGSDAPDLKSKLVELMRYGTEADLEYLYKVINGDGWRGIGGRATSNIGYLMPALIRLDLGNQKFVGVVSNVGVTHLAFTRDLVPIRTDVDITVDLRANIQPTTNNGAVGR